MIKFFRKIRQDFLVKGNMGKYFKYAIGEILLVMVGILLALQVNNWNTQRKNELKTRILLEQVYYELLDDIEEAQLSILYYQRKDSLIQRVLAEEVSEADILGSNIYTNLAITFSLLEFHTAGFDNLVRMIDDIPPKYNSLLKLLQDTYDMRNVIEKQQTYLSEFALRKREADMRSHPWISGKTREQQNAKVDYYMNDLIYRNEITEYNAFGQHLVSNYRVFINLAKFAGRNIQTELGLSLSSSSILNAVLIPSKEQLKDYEGSYEKVKGNVTYIDQSSIKSTKQYLIFSNRFIYLMDSVDVFKRGANNLHFKRSKSGEVTGFEVWSPDGEVEDVWEKVE